MRPGERPCSRADLDAYGPNPKHQEVVALEREVADWLICDYGIAARVQNLAGDDVDNGAHETP